MTITLLLFGAATDLLGTSETTLEVPNNSTVTTFKEILANQFPELAIMSSYAIAVNENYASNETVLKENDIIAIIPPVSGG